MISSEIGRPERVVGWCFGLVSEKVVFFKVLWDFAHVLPTFFTVLFGGIIGNVGP